MLRRAFRHGSLYLATALFARIVNFAVLPIYARVLTPAEFGVYELIAVFAALAGIAIVLEVSQAVARFYPDASDDEERKEYASAAFWYTVASYSVFAAACALLAFPLSAWLLGSDAHAGVLRVALLSVWSNGICYLLQNQLRWQLDVRHYALSAAATTLLSQSVALPLVLILDQGLTGLFTGSFVGGAAGSLVAYRYCRKSIVPRFNSKKLAAMLRFSAPLALSGLAVFAGRNVDRIVINELMTLEDVGFYAVAGRIAAVVSVLLAAVQASLLPLATALRQEARTPDDLGRIFRYFLAAVLSLLFALTVFSREIMLIVGGERYLTAHLLIPLLAAGTLLSGMYALAPGLWLTKRTRWMLAINVATAVLAVGLNVAWIPAWGTLGAATATLAAGLANFAGYFVANQLTYPLPTSYGRIAGATGLCLACSIAVQFIPPDAYVTKAALAVAGTTLIAAPLLSPAEGLRLLTAALREVRFGADRH